MINDNKVDDDFDRWFLKRIYCVSGTVIISLCMNSGLNCQIRLTWIEEYQASFEVSRTQNNQKEWIKQRNVLDIEKVCQILCIIIGKTLKYRRVDKILSEVHGLYIITASSIVGLWNNSISDLIWIAAKLMPCVSNPTSNRSVDSRFI
jgi:hypothetical protein